MFDLLAITSDDLVIFAGDMVDGGEDSGKVLDIAARHHAILGNHERHHTEMDEKYSSGLDPAEGRYHWHALTRSQLSSSHYEYMRSLPHFIRLPQHNAVVVHAGVFPGLSIEDQSIRHVTSMQAIDPSQGRESYWMGAPTLSSKSRPNDGYQFWTNFWQGPERVIFGHSVLNKPLLTPYAIGIDGGCRFGGELWAYVMPEERIYAVKSRQPRGDEWTGHVIDRDNDVRTF